MHSLTWERINTAFQAKFPNILALVDCILTLPSGSVEAERGFSVMKQVKTDWRSNLTQDSLSDLMLVQLESPEISQFEPTQAIHLWNKAGPRSRRPTFVLQSDSSDEDSEDEPLSLGVSLMMEQTSQEQLTLMLSSSDDASQDSDTD